MSTYSRLEIEGLAAFSWDNFRNSGKTEYIPPNLTATLSDINSLAGYALSLQSECEVTFSTNDNNFITLMFLEGTTYINQSAFGGEWIGCEPVNLDSSIQSPFIVRIKGPFLFRLRAKDNSFVHLSTSAVVNVTQHAIELENKISEPHFDENLDPQKVTFPFLSLNTKKLELLKRNAERSELKRYRVNLHDAISDLHHDMVIVFMRESSVPCSRHNDKDELIIVLYGSVTVNIFDSELTQIQSITLSSDNFFNLSILFIPRGLIHSFEFLSPFVITREITTGPFQPELTEVFYI